MVPGLPHHLEDGLALAGKTLQRHHPHYTPRGSKTPVNLSDLGEDLPPALLQDVPGQVQPQFLGLGNIPLNLRPDEALPVRGEEDPLKPQRPVLLHVGEGPHGGQAPGPKAPKESPLRPDPVVGGGWCRA